MIKRKMETPTFEKIDFKLSDPTMCAGAVASGATTDNGVVTSPTDSQSNSAIGN